MKRAAIGIVFLTMGLTFCACSRNQNDKGEETSPAVEFQSWSEGEATESEKESIEKVEFPEQFNETINGVVFETALEVPKDLNQKELIRSTATKQRPDKDSALALLGDGKEVAEKTESVGEGQDGEFDSWYGTFTDGTTLAIGATLSYSTERGGKIAGAFQPSSNADQFFQEQTFGYASPEQAFESIKDTVSQLGYRLEQYDFSCYALDYQTMQNQPLEESLKPLEGSYSWSEEDNAYYFFAQQKYQGLPVYFGMADFPQDDESYRPIEGIYSADGIERLGLTDLYDFSKQEEQIQLLDFSIIAEKIAQKYGDILTGAEYKVNRAKLYQTPVRGEDGTYDIKIAWLVVTTESGTDSELNQPYEYEVYSLIDAETGEELTI